MKCGTVLATLAAFWAATSAHCEPIDYTVSPVSDAQGPAIRIAVGFDGDQDGETRVDLPSRWAGSDALWRSLSDFRGRGGELVPPSTEDPEHLAVRHAPGARVTLTYRVDDGQAGAPDARDYEKARPVIEGEWFQLHGEGVFAMPSGRGDAPARFAWGAVPEGWTLASDLELAAMLTADDVAHGIFVGGTALRLHEADRGGHRLRLAAVGTWDFADEALLDWLEGLVASENAMLVQTPRDFLVTLVPLTGAERGAVSFGGTGRTSGFALSSTANVPAARFTRLLAHEYAHRWFGGAWPTHDDTAADYWFSEGFDDWFSARAMVRAGLWTPAQWRAAVNEVLFRYAASSARDLSDAELTDKFWTDPDAMQMQYDRGQVVAWLLDRDLRGRGSSLLALLRGLSGELRPDESAIAALSRLAGPGRVEAARVQAARAILPADLFAPCGRLARAERPVYDRGFTLDGEDRVATVRRDGPAWRAGVRPGMGYVRRTVINWGDARQPFAAVFSDGADERELRWLPAGERIIRYQALGDGADERAECAAMVRGDGLEPAP
ncbi:hypothetical protein B2G71_01405 [Novosphingobium sp. PC22D]|uniref:M61 family metallopeptidase n=1 Tax=Novosphingobium sp. PC22D TaxID=1962403 RepID=UPI000BFAE4F6|nr:hypothetical protein [Novosphingobium sp. PC22D]PEQ14288.1 hypothetical protein B2G71_01405 [Novosphingobium sp. PC22D]